MAKTVKEIIKDRISYFKTVYEGRLDLIKNEILILENILQAHENEIFKKDELIRYYDEMYSQCCLEKLEILEKHQKDLDDKDKEIKELKDDLEYWWYEHECER